jgi:hypothetical protein
VTRSIRLNRNQRAFFEAARTHDIVVDSGAWRSGKSFELCLFAILRMKKYPGIAEFIGRKELASLRETTFLKFREILVEFLHLREGVDFNIKLSPKPEISFPNGSSCVFGDLDAKSINKWLSAEFSDVLVDEAQEIEEIAFEKIRSRQTQQIIERMSRGRRKNKMLLAMNPPESAELHWTHRKFRDPANRIRNAVMIYSKIENNRGNIPTTYIEDMYASVDARTAEIYLRGLWVPMQSNLVFADYLFPVDADGEYVEGGNLKHLEPRPDFDSFISLDFGWTHPMSVGVWQHDPRTDTYHRLYEMVESHIKPETYCDLLVGREIPVGSKRYRLPVTARNARLVMGFEAEQRRQESNGLSNLHLMKRLLAERGVSPETRVVRISLYDSILAVRNHILTARGERKILIDPRYCRRFISDARTYHYPAEGAVRLDEPEKDNISDHTQDETRYLIGSVSPIQSAPIWRTT